MTAYVTISRTPLIGPLRQYLDASRPHRGPVLLNKAKFWKRGNFDMRKMLSNSLAVVAGVFSLPVPGTHAAPTQAATAEHRNEPAHDRRLAFLRSFFTQAHCPAAELSAVFLEAADRYGLDWRLLPSLSFIETTGGKAARNNNLFGWDSGRAVFSSAAACIHSVASSLKNSSLYRNKDLDGILRTYNRNLGYSQRVKDVMRRIAPVVD